MNCGTLYGYGQHKAANTPACEWCKSAKAKHDAGTIVVAPAAPSKARVAQCGTASGAKKHRREKTEMCQPCRDAENGKAREWKVKNKGATATLGRPVVNGCGTAAAAKRHRTNGEPIDDACAAALIKYNAEQYAKRAARKKAKAQA